MSTIRKHANGQSCIRCDAYDETTVLAHYSGPWQHRFGKGKGIKGHDVAAAELCRRCHTYFDEYHDGNTIERSEEFLALCLLTNIEPVGSITSDQQFPDDCYCDEGCTLMGKHDVCNTSEDLVIGDPERLEINGTLYLRSDVAEMSYRAIELERDQYKLAAEMNKATIEGMRK